MRERADQTALPDRLRLEVQYALQCRRDDNMIRTKPTTVRSMAGWLAGSGEASLLGRSEQDWRASCPPQAAKSGHPVALLIYGRHQWDTSLPSSAVIFPEDYPRPGQRLPRALAGHIMAQVEDPAKLERQGKPQCTK